MQPIHWHGGLSLLDRSFENEVWNSEEMVSMNMCQEDEVNSSKGARYLVHLPRNSRPGVKEKGRARSPDKK
jgi:hypothetical protein